MGAGASVIHGSRDTKLQFMNVVYYIVDYVFSSQDSQGSYDGEAVVVSEKALLNNSVKEFYCTAVVRLLRRMYESSSSTKSTSIPIEFCNFLDFEDRVEQMFSRGITPILLDSSPDDKACTYYSYQPDYALFEAKTMVMDHARQIPLMQCLEQGRKYLVNAMKFGKTLVVRLGNSVPDFKNVFNDVNLSKQFGGFDARGKESGFFPIELFSRAGAELRNEENGWPLILFREEDMKPHKNFAFCRDSFRVMISSQLTVEDVLHYFWGWNVTQTSSLKRARNRPHFPSSSNFGIICIAYDEDDVPV